MNAKPDKTEFTSVALALKGAAIHSRANRDCLYEVVPVFDGDRKAVCFIVQIKSFDGYSTGWLV